MTLHCGASINWLIILPSIFYIIVTVYCCLILDKVWEAGLTLYWSSVNHRVYTNRQPFKWHSEDGQFSVFGRSHTRPFQLLEWSRRNRANDAEVKVTCGLKQFPDRCFGLLGGINIPMSHITLWIWTHTHFGCKATMQGTHRLTRHEYFAITPVEFHSTTNDDKISLLLYNSGYLHSKLNINF